MNSLDDAALGALVGLHPLGRLGESEEVAELILWLASSKSSFVTGAYYAADGGQVLNDCNRCSCFNHLARIY